MVGSTQSKVSKTLRFLWLGMPIALFVFILIPVGQGLASPGERPVLQVAAVPSFQKIFLPATIGPGSVATLQFSIGNDDTTPVTDLAFVDTLPAGLTIATPANASTDCDDATLNAPDGGDTISFSGGRLGGEHTCTILVDVTSSTPGTYSNTTGDLTSSAGNSGTASANLTVATDRPGFSKEFAPGTIPFGGRSTLTFTIDNTLNSNPAFYLTFTDILPNGMEVADPANVSSTCTGGELIVVPSSSLISYLNGSLAGSASCTISVDISATQTGNNVSEELTSGYPVVSSGKASARLDVTLDDLQLTKSFIADPIPPGGTVTLEFTIYNRSRFWSATNITFSDDLDAGLPGLVATGLPQNDVCGAGSVLSGTSLLTLTGGNLPPEGICTFSLTLQVPAGIAAGAYTNTTSSITGDVSGSSITGSPASDILFIEPVPLLTKEFLDAETFTSDPVVGAGEEVVIRFAVQNTSLTSSATEIAFIDELTTFLPFPVSVVLPSPGFCGSGASMALVSLGTDRQGLSMTGGSLTAGSSCTFDVTLTLPVGLPNGVYTNTTEDIAAMIDGETVLGRPATDDVVVVAAPTLYKEFTDDPVVPGETVTLEFTLSHDEFAPGDATGIAFTDDLNATLAGLATIGLPDNDICGPGSQLTGTTLITFSGGNMEPGETCTFSVTLQVPTGAMLGTYANTTSSVTATVLGATATENPASDDLWIAGLNFTKEFIDDPVIPGGVVTLQFMIENSSTTDNASGIAFTDDLSTVLPGTPDLVVLTPLPSAFCGGTISIIGTSLLTFSGGSLLAGESCSFAVVIQVPVGVPSDSYNNVTSSLSAVIRGINVYFDPAIDTLAVQSGWLLLDKSFLDDPVRPGDLITLEFAITNTHTSQPAIDITFTDDLDASLSGMLAVGLPTNPCGTGSEITGTSFLTLTGGNLAAGASCRFNVTLQVPDEISVGDYTNTTSPITGLINGLEVDGDPASDDLRVNYLTLSKSFESSVLAGNAVTLTFTIENHNPLTAASDLAFSDNLEAVLPGLIASGLPVNDVCGSGSQVAGTSFLTLTGGNLPPGGSCTFDIVLQIPVLATPGTFQNTTSDLFSNGLLVGAPAVAMLTIDPTPVVSIDDVVVDEGAGASTFTVALDALSVWDVTVNYTTMDATALAGLDYIAEAGMITIPAGDITTTVIIPILEDTVDETSETFTVTLSNPVNATIADGEGIGLITDNDAPPTLSIEDLTVDEGAGTAIITVTLSSASGFEILVNYVTSDGTAQVGMDYLVVSGTLAIPVGETNGTFEVTILEDSIYETDETVMIGLSDPVNTTLIDSTAILTILDNDYVLYLPTVFRNYFGERLIYENDFEDPVGDEWTASITELAPNGESFLGQFATDAITLTLNNLPEHNQVRVIFDLYIIRSWDGNNQYYGPDIWEFALDENLILQTTFSNWRADRQAYPGFYPEGDFPARSGAVANNTLGYIWQSYPLDATYRLTYVIDHKDSDFRAVFSSRLMALSDEGWGIDNIEVVLLP